jgi:hypothetical protein
MFIHEPMRKQLHLLESSWPPAPPGRRGDNARMAYDDDLANRIRELVLSEPGVVEQRMFGGLAFLINGNMSVTASRQGGVLLRVDPGEADRSLPSKR